MMMLEQILNQMLKLVTNKAKPQRLSQQMQDMIDIEYKQDKEYVKFLFEEKQRP